MMKKSDRLRLNAALDKALAPPKQKRGLPADVLDDFDDRQALGSQPAIAAPSDSVAPPKISPQPLRNGGAAKSVAPPLFAAPPASVMAPNTPHTRVPNEIFDRVMPSLSPLAQVVLWRLYRLSAGFGNTHCRVSIAKLAQNTGIRPTQLRVHIKALEIRGLLRRLNVDLSNRNQHERGIEFEVLLPRLAPTESEAPSKSVGASEIVAPTESEPNKETHKETHTNTGAAARARPVVGVGSRFGLQECRRYAEHLKASGQGITNPGGFATKIHRSGEADELIAAFLEPVEAAKAVDASRCPDCHGTGFYEPGGAGKGVARCTHAKLQQGA